MSAARLSESWRAKYGPWAVVTGASDGIGREMASELAASGMNLVLVARRRAVLEQLANDWQARHGVEVRVLALDLSSMDAVETLAASTDDLAVGLLVACAGFGTSGPLLDSDLQRELTMVDVNCRSVLAASYHFGRRFAEQGRGGLILMSSLLAFQGVPRAAHYAATKAYVQNLAEGLRLEWKPHGVDVLASAPGPVQSGFAERANMRMGLALQAPSVARTTLRALGRRSTVRPGWLSKLLEGSLSTLPRWGRSLIVGQVMKGMTQHQEQETRYSEGRSAS